MTHMLRFSPRLTLALLALLVGAPSFLAACDQSSPADDANTLLTDARIARQGGDLDTAIELLEQAHDLDAASAEIRVELASAYFERDDVDLFDLDRVALFLLDQQPGDGATGDEAEPAPTAAFKGGASCTYADDPEAVPFDPREVDGYPELAANRATVERVLELLAVVIPEELRAMDLCTGIEDGALVYEHEAALAAMRAFGLSDTQIASTLAINAVARLLNAYFFLAEDLAPQTQWYRLPDQRIGLCADDVEALRAQSQDAIRDLGEVLTSLDLRDRTLGGNAATRDLIAHAIDAYEAVADHLGPYCESN